MVQVLTRSQDLVGKKIKSQEGHEVGQITDVIIDPKKRKLLALMFGSKDPQQASAVKFKKVNEIVEDTVFIDSKDIKEQAKNLLSAQKKSKFSQTKVVNSENKEIGTLDDFYYNTKTGAIEGLEVNTIKNGNSEKIRLDIKDVEELKTDTVKVKKNDSNGGSTQKTNIFSFESSSGKQEEKRGVTKKMADKIKEMM